MVGAAILMFDQSLVDFSVSTGPSSMGSLTGRPLRNRARPTATFEQIMTRGRYASPLTACIETH